MIHSRVGDPEEFYEAVILSLAFRKDTAVFKPPNQP